MNRKMILCAAWIGSTLLIGGLLWFFTMSYRTRLLTDMVNNTLAASSGGQLEMQGRFSLSPASVMGGDWFKINNSSDRAFVFTIIRNGISAACVALVDNGNKVKLILPLSDNALQLTKEMPLPVYHFYTGRIERDAQNRFSKREALR